MRIFGLIIKNPSLAVTKAREKLLIFAKFYYRIIFLLKRRQIRQYDNLVEHKNVFFTIELDKSGFTDQLIQFIVIYNIGSALKLKYIHTDLYSGRSFNEGHQSGKKNNSSQKYKDVYDFLGINDYFNQMFSKSTLAEKTINADYYLKDDSYFLKRGIAGLKDLTAYIKLDLLKLLNHSDNDILVKFRLNGVSSFFNLYNSSKDYHTFEHDFRKIYEKQRLKRPLSLNLKHSSHSLFVHIRQGDTSVIKMPWEKFVLVWGRMENSFKEFSSFEEIGNNHILAVDTYYRFLADLLKSTDNNTFSTTVFSDGFRRAFRMLFKNREKVNWTEAKWEQLKSVKANYDNEAFRKFSNLDDLKLYIGEDNDKLYDLIHHALNADFVIIGTQQRMIPKLLSIYCDTSKMPLVLVLTNKMFKSLNLFGRPELQPFFVRVNVEDYKPQTLATIVNQFLQSRIHQKN